MELAPFLSFERFPNDYIEHYVIFSMTFPELTIIITQIKHLQWSLHEIKTVIRYMLES